MSARAAAARGKAASKPAPHSPRSQVLPGLGNKRIQAIDNILEGMSTRRQRMATDRADDADDSRAVLTLMRKHSRTSYLHAGLEAVRAAGEEKLRVRSSKSEATAEVEADDEQEPVGQVEGVEEAAAVDDSGGDEDTRADGDEDFDLP